MIVVGLTGSIGMGKTVAAQMLRRLGLPLHDADAEVHHLMAPGGAAVKEVLAAFPEAAGGGGGVDRRILGPIVFRDPALLRRLESILHPKVRTAEQRFLAACARCGEPVAILDVPLLYETHSERRCDAVIVVTAPEFLQRQRVLRRPGMTEERFRRILAQQVPDRDKRRRTPYVVQTGIGRRHTLANLVACLAAIRRKHGARVTGLTAFGRGASLAHSIGSGRKI